MSRAAQEYVHLRDETRLLLSLRDDERVQRIRGARWIGYSRAKEVLAKLQELLEHPRVHRMPNLLIVGPTDNGKTMIADRFARQHPPSDNTEGEGIIVPVLFVQAPTKPDENLFYNALLDAIFAPYKASDHPSKKYSQIVRTFQQLKLKMLIIDEIQDILAGHLEKQRQLLNVIKHLGNELKIPIVALGVKDAIRALQNDPQLANRFEIAPLPRWQLDQDFLRLLVSFERMLPLRQASDLTELSIATRLHGMSEGLIGALATVLRKAAIVSIEQGVERIDHKMLDSIQWTPPSEARRAAEKLV